MSWFNLEKNLNRIFSFIKFFETKCDYTRIPFLETDDDFIQGLHRIFSVTTEWFDPVVSTTSLKLSL